MPEPQQPADHVLVAIAGERALVQMVGRGSFRVSTALKEFALAALERGARQLVVDTAACVGMDSTFMGVLAGIAMRYRNAAGVGARVILVNLSPKNRGLLATLGLDRIVVTHLAGATPPELAEAFAPGEGLTALSAPEDGRTQRAETMLEAHETLVELTPDNLPRFRDVLDFLRRDVHGTGAPGENGP